LPKAREANVDTQATLKAAQALPLPERLELLFRLWDQFLDEGWEPALSDDVLAELDRRWTKFQADPNSGLSWEQVVAHVRRPR
jgi:putative addiction module component (TIGR02574 family)